MLLFRSEEDVAGWCRARDREPGATMDLGTLERLARAWYGDRLDPGWRPRTRERSQAVLTAAGLTGPFWRLP